MLVEFPLGGVVEPTEIVAELVAVPAEFVAVKVYVVVAAGLTVVEPDAATVPMLGLMLTLVAFAVAHESVTD